MNMGLAAGIALLVLWVVIKRWRVRYRVEVTHNLRAPADAVWAALADFEQWPRWSPWLMHEPDAHLHFERPTEVGGFYTWTGQRIGAGRITHTARPAPHTLHAELQFLKPFKARADIVIELRALDALNTKVRWRMDGQLPIFMAPMKATMQTMMAKDFELGLARLAGAVNPQAPHPSIEFGEVAERMSFHAISHRETTTLAALPQVFGQWMPQLGALAGGACIEAPLGVYHRIDDKTGEVDVEVAYPVAADTPGASLIRGGRYFKVTLKGDYQFLRLAWHAAHGQARMRQLKWDPRSPALERYLSDPAQVPQPNDWVTELYLPVQE